MEHKVETILDKLLDCFHPNNVEETLEKCLACFRSGISEVKHPGVRSIIKSELQSIARMYQINIIMHALNKSCSPIIDKMLKNNPQEHVYPEIQELVPRRGRPVNISARRLVMDCKMILIKYGCKHGVSRNMKRTYESPVSKLAGLVHELSGMPASKSWGDLVERLSSQSDRAKMLEQSEYETGLEKPILEGEDPELDALVEIVMKSWGC